MITRTSCGRYFLFTVPALLTFVSVGCNSMAGTGALAGGGVGAGVGTLFGHATGNPKTGAVVGGLIGSGVGTAIGAEADERRQSKEDEIRLAEANAAVNANTQAPLGLTDVISMTQQGVSEEVIINYLRQTNSSFRLSPSDLAYLRQQQVGDRVVNEMINSGSRVSIAQTAPRTVVVREPGPTTIIYERGPRVPVFMPPPVGFGFHYVRVRR